jgi:hypothetical protein
MILYSHIAGSSNGRTIASGAMYLGSSPSPAADFFHTCEAQKNVKIVPSVARDQAFEVSRLYLAIYMSKAR